MVYGIADDMTGEELRRFVHDLEDRAYEAELGLRARDAVLQDLLEKQKELEERLSKYDEVLLRVDELKKELQAKEHELKISDRKLAELTVKLKLVNKKRFDRDE